MDICGPKIVNLAYNNEPKEFILDETVQPPQMVKKAPYMKKGIKNNISWDWEILDLYFKNYNVEPLWMFCNYTWGTINHTTGLWSGAMGRVSA